MSPGAGRGKPGSFRSLERLCLARVLPSWGSVGAVWECCIIALPPPFPLLLLSPSLASVLLPFPRLLRSLLLTRAYRGLSPRVRESYEDISLSSPFLPTPFPFLPPLPPPPKLSACQFVSIHTSRHSRIYTLKPTQTSYISNFPLTFASISILLLNVVLKKNVSYACLDNYYYRTLFLFCI